MIFIFAIIFYVLILSGETFKGLPLNENNSLFFHCVYFSVVTATTLGYGDFYPQTDIAKIITMIEPFMTAVFFVTASSIFLSNGDALDIVTPQPEISEL